MMWHRYSLIRVLGEKYKPETMDWSELNTGDIKTNKAVSPLSMTILQKRQRK